MTLKTLAIRAHELKTDDVITGGVTNLTDKGEHRLRVLNNPSSSPQEQLTIIVAGLGGIIAERDRRFTVEREVPEVKPIPVGTIVTVRGLSGYLLGSPLVRTMDGWHNVDNHSRSSFTDREIQQYLDNPNDPTAIVFDPKGA